MRPRRMASDTLQKRLCFEELHSFQIMSRYRGGCTTEVFFFKAQLEDLFGPLKQLPQKLVM